MKTQKASGCISTPKTQKNSDFLNGQLFSLLAILVVALGFQSHGATRTWNGGAGTPFWANINNWVEHVVPSTNDDVVFPTGPTVRSNVPPLYDFSSPGLRSITCSSAGYRTSGGDLVLNHDLAITHATISGVTTIDSFIELASNTTVSVTSIRATLNLNGDIDVTDHLLTFNNAGTINLSDNIIDQQDHSCPAVGFIKQGLGLLQVPNTNSLCGPAHILDGALRVTGALPRSLVIVTNAGVLEGTGLVHGISAVSGGTVQPGTSGPGRLRSNTNVIFEAGSTFSVVLNGTVAGSNYSQLTVTGLVSIFNATLDVSLGFDSTLSNKFIIIDNQGANLVNGPLFDGLTNGAKFVVNGRELQIDYHGGDGNDVELTTTAIVGGAVRLWDGGGTTGNWSDGGNWSNNIAPVSGDHVVFPANAPRNVNTNDFSRGLGLGSLTLFGSNYVIRGNQLAMGGGITNLNTAPAASVPPTNTLLVPLSFKSDLVVLVTNSTLVLGGSLSGRGGFRKLGADGVVEFQGTNSNTYLGLTTLGSGQLNLAKQSGAIAIPADLSIADTTPSALATNSVFILDNEQISDKALVTIGANSRVTIRTNLQETISSLALADGATFIATGASVQIQQDVSAEAGSSTVLGPLALLAGTATITVADNGTLTFPGVVSGPAAIVKDGGGTLVFSGTGANTYSSDTLVTEGVLTLTKSAGINAVPGALSVGPGQVMVRFAEQIPDTVPVSIVDGGTLTLLGSASETIGPLTMRGGAITMGTGTLTLNGNVVVESSANSSTIAGTLSLAGAVIGFDVADGAADSDLTIFAQLNNGGLIKDGAGIMVLSGTNTYSGSTTINSGRLLVNGRQTASSVFVAGGLLGGQGVVGPITVSSGTLDPGNSPGVLSVSGDVLFSAGSTFFVDLDGLAAGSGYDQLSVTGSVDLANARLDGAVGFSTTVGNTFTILRKEVKEPISGIFNGLPEAAVFLLGGQAFLITYAGGDGNDVVLTRVHAAAAISAPQKLANGQFQFQGSAESGLTYTIQANSNLSTTNWVVVGAVPANGSGVFSFTDTNAPLFQARFYRALSP